MTWKRARPALLPALILTGALLLGCAPIRPTRVALIGDSITAGAGIENADVNGYPAQLDRMLGPGWELRNFGSSGTSLVRKGRLPYRLQKKYAWSLDFQPDIVVIMLGTNDTKPVSWDKYGNEFIDDYKSMIAAYRALPSRPVIWICNPVPAFPGFGGINEKTLTEGVIPKIEQVARETGVNLLDLHAALADHKDLFPDTVHPNAQGARLIAESVYQALTGKPAPAAR